jgi:hypothetical protein|eukprot:6223482-Prymnesium_polylepis.1
MSCVHLINPNLMQKYDAEESCKYLVKLMPKGMATDGDLLTMELKSTGKWGNTTATMEACRKKIVERQNAAVKVDATRW